MTIPKSYSDVIDEIDVPEVDDTKPEYHAVALVNDSDKLKEKKKKKVAATPQAAMQSIMPEWQRQAILNSVNCSPQQMLIQSLNSQQCCNIQQNLQSQLTNTTQTVWDNLSHEMKDIGESLEALYAMLDKMGKKYYGK